MSYGKDIFPVLCTTSNSYKNDISEIYHPFRQERISLKNDKFLSKLVVFLVYGL